jgi:hypothetical protein
MNSDRWRELKQKMTDESDLSVIWSYYMDHFADQPKFVTLGAPVTGESREFLDAVAQNICQQLFGAETPIGIPILILIPQQRFYHGPLQAGGRLGGIIYDENTKTGLLAIPKDFPSTEMVEYSRFSKPIELPPPPDRPDLN